MHDDRDNRLEQLGARQDRVREQAFAARELNGDTPISVQEFYEAPKLVANYREKIP